MRNKKQEKFILSILNKHLQTTYYLLLTTYYLLLTTYYLLLTTYYLLTLLGLSSTNFCSASFRRAYGSATLGIFCRIYLLFKIDFILFCKNILPPSSAPTHTAAAHQL